MHHHQVDRDASTLLVVDVRCLEHPEQAYSTAPNTFYLLLASYYSLLTAYYLLLTTTVLTY